MMQRRAFLLSTLPISGVAASAPAALLTINGRLRKASGAQANTFEYSESSLKALRQSQITTSTFWTPKAIFSGPRLAAILEDVGAVGSVLLCEALDNYSVKIPWSDLAKFDPIVAHSKDGVPLPRDRFGPLWLIYPRDQHPKVLDGPLAGAKFIWQLTRISVQ